MDAVTEAIKLNEQEERELRDAQSLYEMDRVNPGWQIIKKHLEDLAFHSWVDPREAPSKEEWEWRELNGFHAANVAKEILSLIDQAAQRADYLDKKKKGIVKVQPMKI